MVTFLHRKVTPRRAGVQMNTFCKTPRRRQATANYPPPGRRANYVFAKDSATPKAITILSLKNSFATFLGRKAPPAGQACSPSLAKGSAPPPGDHQLDLKSLCLLLFLSHQVCMDREKNRPTIFPLLRGRAPEFAGIRAEHLSDHGKSGKSPAVSGERFCWTGPVRPL